MQKNTDKYFVICHIKGNNKHKYIYFNRKDNCIYIDIEQHLNTLKEARFIVSYCLKAYKNIFATEIRNIKYVWNLKKNSQFSVI